MPMWEVSKASSHPSSQALATPPASFPANKASVPPDRLQSSSSTTPPCNPMPTHSTSFPPTPPLISPWSRRWYIREGWLNVVPSKGAEAKPKMFFLFSDMLLQAKRCSPLQLTNGDKFIGQHMYPLQECTLEKVFGHTRSKGGLLSLTFPRAKLLLMSSNQEDLNDWYQSLSSAIRKLQSKQTVVHRREELNQRPSHSAADSHNILSASSNNPGRKRNMVSADTSEPVERPPVEWEGSAPKRMKQSDTPEPSAEASSSGCVIL
ncbi:hypothetical protein INR49_000193 [Caranx melampygus]|nr:hypothetical protein INR49_000193 [Caranx melampygus]